MSGGGALQEAEERFRLAFEDAPIGMALVAPDGQWLRVNRALCEIFGYPEDALLTKTFDDLIHPDDLSTDKGHVQRLLAGEVRSVSVENRGLHAGGHQVWVNISVSLVRDEAGVPLSFIAQFQDITERKQMEHELWELALVDVLTGLHNRRSFLLLAEQAIKEAARAKRPVITLFVDVDQMKTINDRHGHAEGDRALCLVAGALRAACRSADIIGRWGGDEFAIVLTEATEMDGIEGRIADHMARAAVAAGYGLTVSVGVARCGPGQACRIEDLLETADQAMYRQKAQRRETA
jgi:diguanylate cyclase (GGDEF)-like protein/PAS domain S-box-containing protein